MSRVIPLLQHDIFHGIAKGNFTYFLLPGKCPLGRPIKRCNIAINLCR